MCAHDDYQRARREARRAHRRMMGALERVRRASEAFAEAQRDKFRERGRWKTSPKGQRGSVRHGIALVLVCVLAALSPAARSCDPEPVTSFSAETAEDPYAGIRAKALRLARFDARS